MSKILLLLLTLVTVAQAALPPTRTGELGGNLSTTFNWRYKQGQVVDLGGVNRLIDTDELRLLSNQNFESPTAGAGWTYVPSGADVMEVETTEVFDGAQSLKVTPAAETFTLTQTVSADKLAGSLVGIKAWIKADFNVLVCFMQGAVEGKCESYTGTNQWQEITAIGDVTAGTDIGIRFKSQVASTGTAYFDFVRTTPNPLTPTDIYASSDWEDCGMTASDFSAAFGSVTNIQDLCRRDGPNLIINVKYDAGTVTGGAAEITPRFRGSSIVIDSLLSSETSWGKHYRGTSAVANHGTVLLTAGQSIVRFGPASSTGAPPVNARPADEVCASSVACIFEATIPVEGWRDTAQGVVVKNVESSDVANTNTFSADVSSVGVVSNENLDWLDGNCSKGGTGTYTCSIKSGIFSVTPNCFLTARPINRIATFNTTSTTSLSIRITSDAGASADDPFGIICQKAGTDFVKESEKVYTVPVDTLTGNSCRLEGNDGRGITVTTESVPFDDIGQCPLGWTSGADGSTLTNGNYYEVQKSNSKIIISGGQRFTASVASAVDLYLNGTFYKRISTTSTAQNHVFSYVSSRGEFAVNDKLAFNVQSGTLSNDPDYHYLNITEEYGDRGLFLGNLPIERKEAVASVGVSTATVNVYVDVPSASLDLTAGQWEICYSVPVFHNWISGASVSSTCVVSVRDGSNNLIADSQSTSYALMSSGNDETMQQQNQCVFVRITSDTTYKLSTVSSQSSSAQRCDVIANDGAFTGAITTQDTASKIWARRIR